MALGKDRLIYKNLTKEIEEVEKANNTWFYQPGGDADSTALHGLYRAGTAGATRGTDSNHANTGSSHAIADTNSADSPGCRGTNSDGTGRASRTSYAGTSPSGDNGASWRTGVHRDGPTCLRAADTVRRS